MITRSSCADGEKRITVEKIFPSPLPPPHFPPYIQVKRAIKLPEEADNEEDKEMSTNTNNINMDELKNVAGGVRTITSQSEIDQIIRVMSIMCANGRTNEAGSYLQYAVPNDVEAANIFKTEGVEALKNYLYRKAGLLK